VAVYSFDLEGRFREIAHRSISTGGELTEQTILETAVSYVTDDYLPALFNEHHGIPAWSKPKYREGNALLDTNELASS
jgi:phage gpG-like protein